MMIRAFKKRTVFAVPILVLNPQYIAPTSPFENRQLIGLCKSFETKCGRSRERTYLDLDYRTWSSGSRYVRRLRACRALQCQFVRHYFCIETGTLTL